MGTVIKGAGPESLAFPTVGVYEVVMVVTDKLGQKDPNPPRRKVKVSRKPAPPQGGIKSPSGDVSIYEGDAVILEAIIQPGVTYEWVVKEQT